MTSITLRLARISVAVSLLLVFQIPAFSQNNRITGQVFGTGHRVLADVYVELLNEINSVLSRTKTNGSGIYAFAGMSGGRFTVLVRPFGTDYEEQSQEVEIVSYVIAGRATSDNQQRDFYLRTRTEASKKKTVNAVVFAQDVPKDAQASYDKAIGDLDDKKVDEGISGLNSAIKAFPTYFAALDRLGVELLKQHKYAEAQGYFERAVEIYIRSSNSWYGLAFVLCAQDKAKEAVAASKKAVELSPESADINLILGMSLRKDKQYAEAETAMLKAKKISGGKSADVLWNLALLYDHDLKNNKRAADELESYLKLKPDHPNAENIRKLIKQLRTASPVSTT